MSPGKITQPYLVVISFESTLQKNNSSGKMASALLRNIVYHYSNHDL